MYGRMSFQRAFMAGDMKMKGDFKILRTLDQVFVFDEKQEKICDEKRGLHFL